MMFLVNLIACVLHVHTSIRLCSLMMEFDGKVKQYCWSCHEHYYVTGIFVEISFRTTLSTLSGLPPGCAGSLCMHLDIHVYLINNIYVWIHVCACEPDRNFVGVILLRSVMIRLG